MKWTSFLISALFLVTTGCAFFQRSPESGYGENRDPWSDAKKTSRVDRSSDDDVHEQAQSQKMILRHLENALSTRKEVEQYSKALPWFKDDAEKIEFLKLPGFEARQQWLQDNDLSSRSQSVTDSMKDLVDSQDIAVGMPESLVKKSWGDPETVEVSGNPQFRNFRWHYNRYISTPDGYKRERKVVYFEGGKVVGWEVE